MRILHADRHEQLFAAGMAWLLLLFVVGVMAATRPVENQVPVHLRALAGASLSRDSGALLLTGGRTHDEAAELNFSLPPPDPTMSRWVVWVGRDPLDSLWLEAPTHGEMAPPPWRTVERDFFHPDPDEGILPSGFILPLPTTWHGEITLVLHARGGVSTALRPRVLREAAAMQMAHRAIALQGMIYAGLFMLALLALSLYSAARDRAFLAMFGSACAAILLLSADNGHLFLMPAMSQLSLWRGAGIWMLSLLFDVAALQMLLRYAQLRSGPLPGARYFDGYCIVLVALAAICLLGLPVFDPWLQSVVTIAWVGAAAGAVVILVEAVRRRVPMAGAILLLVVMAVLASAVRLGVSRGWFMDMLWTRFGYQFTLVVAMSVLMVGLISRIGEFRQQRDRDRLARVDSEQKMARESARARLILALRGLRAPNADSDVEWLAFRLLLESLQPHIPAQASAVIAQGYHGHDFLVLEPIEGKDMFDISSRQLVLKRQAMQGLPLQQAGTHEGRQCIEALIPLAIRGPAWGALLLVRMGSDGFTTDEMALVDEFARIVVSHADDAVASIQLRRSAELDALTGTFNRRSIDQWLSRAFMDAHRQKRELSLLFIDIDNFKSVNDRLGHAGGDHCLRQVATALRSSLQAGDTLGRYGGEEFVVLLPGRVGADAREMGERLRSAVERCECLYESHSERLTVSIGVSTRLDRESTPAAAVERADKALYAAKDGGRNCVRVAPAGFK
jgi:diguanylate cyclase (GGDEF)-like protein